MDLTHVIKFISAHWLEIGGLFTLGISLWIAFGPLRHRLPRVLTRMGRYSATLKLLFLSGVCWFSLYRFLTDEIPSAALNWLVGCAGVILMLCALYVFTRKQGVPGVPPAPRTREFAPPPEKTQGPPAKPATPARSSAPAPHV